MRIRRTAVGNIMHPTQMEPAASSDNQRIGLFLDGARGCRLRRGSRGQQPDNTAGTLVDVAGGEDLHDTIWAVACYWMVGNFYSETVVKTLEHGLHGTQRRTQACATRLGSARHRARQAASSCSSSAPRSTG